MPIYEYECGACGTKLERLIRKPGDAPAACPRCGKAKLRRVYSAFSVARAAVAGGEGPPCGSCSEDDSCPYGGGDSACDACDE
jgi:putative FmdB family regulatory protein